MHVKRYEQMRTSFSLNVCLPDDEKLGGGKEVASMLNKHSIHSIAFYGNFANRSREILKQHVRLEPHLFKGKLTWQFEGEAL